MSDGQRQTAFLGNATQKRSRMFGQMKAGTSAFSNPSLISPHTATLANPTRGFGLPTNNDIQTATKKPQATQTTGEQSLLSEAIEQRSFSHDISRIALHRPQAKLTVGEPGDKYEQEADSMANQVMRMVLPNNLNTPTVQPVQNSLQRKCSACEQEEDKVQPKASSESAGDGGLQAGDNIESRLNSSKSGGNPLPNEVRLFMEPRFGADFSQVRVHTGSEAVQMNRELNAQAFTHQQHVYFGAGKSPAKDALTAHELTHVVQQTGSLQTSKIQRDEAEEMGLFQEGCFRNSKGIGSEIYETKRDFVLNRIDWKLIHPGACTECEGKSMMECCEPGDRDC
jgi:hypothetical protein